MQFNDNMPIYLQIADRICENILSGKWGSDCRIPSVREMGAEYQVNPNTMMRSYDYLQQKNIIYNKRGIGYFVSPGSISLILEDQRKKKNRMKTNKKTSHETDSCIFYVAFARIRR